MKKLLIAAAAVVACLASPRDADAAFWNRYKVEAKANFFFRIAPVGAYGTPPQAGPWYLYWPLEAHFQHPAPGAYPPYASPMSLPPGFGMQKTPAPAVTHPVQTVPKLPPKKTTQPVYKPVSWYGPAPVYWYPGR